MDKWYIKMSNIIHIVKFTGPILEDLAKIATLVFDQVVMKKVNVEERHTFIVSHSIRCRKGTLYCVWL